MNKAISKIKGAPEWLKNRMKALKKLPPPTLKEVEESFKASAKFRKNNND